MEQIKYLTSRELDTYKFLVQKFQDSEDDLEDQMFSSAISALLHLAEEREKGFTTEVYEYNRRSESTRGFFNGQDINTIYSESCTGNSKGEVCTILKAGVTGSSARYN